MENNHNFIKLKNVRREHLKEIAGIDQQAFGLMGYPLFVLRQFYDLFPNLFILAEDKNQNVLGYVLGGINYFNKSGWILSLATEKESKKKGIGRQLLFKLIDRFKDMDLCTIQLTVGPKNLAALNLYLNLGFKIKETVDDYYGDDSQRILLVLDLKD